MKNKIPLSVIILAHRNDQRLRNAISSAQFAEQVLVIDTAHNAKLKKTLKGMTFELVNLPSQSEHIIDFSDVRNQSLEKATQDWVFFLDSDEEIEAESIPEIKKIIEEDQFHAAFIRRKDIFHNYEMKWGEVGKHWLLRLGKKDSLRYLRPVHEIAKFSGNVAYPPIVITHFAHLSITEFIEKIVFYAKLDADYRVKHHQTFNIVELLLFPPAKFISNYFFKLGLLDGWRGLVYATVMSLHSFFVRVYVYQLELPRQQ